MRAGLFVNAHSRRGPLWFDEAEQALKPQLELTESRLFRSGDALNDAVKAFLQSGGEYVILGGGDGTLNHLTQLIMDHGALLGVLPTGTGNAFARDLGIPIQAKAACDVLVERREHLVDVGKWDKHIFLNLATVGVTSKIADALNPMHKRKLGFGAYLAALAKVAVKVRPFHLEMNLDGVHHEMETVQWVLGNGRYHAGPFALGADASLDEGMLHGYAVVGKGVASLLRYGAAMSLGRHLESNCIQGFAAKSGEIQTTPPKRVVLDGETRFRTPGKFQVISGALRVVVGQALQQPSRSLPTS